MLEERREEDSNSEAEDEGEDDDKDVHEQSVRRSARIRGGITMPKRYALTTKKPREGKHNDAARNEAIKRAKANEVHQVFKECEALDPMRKEHIPQGIVPLSMHLFTIEKFKVDGTHVKFKSRLLLHGNEQDALLYPDRSSPTVAIHSIMTSLVLAACNKE